MGSHRAMFYDHQRWERGIGKGRRCSSPANPEKRKEARAYYEGRFFFLRRKEEKRITRGEEGEKK